MVKPLGGQFQIAEGGQFHVDICIPPVKDGYDFDGWYYNEAPFKADITPNEDINVVAKYTKTNYSVTFLN